MSYIITLRHSNPNIWIFKLGFWDCWVMGWWSQALVVVNLAHVTQVSLLPDLRQLDHLYLQVWQSDSWLRFLPLGLNWRNWPLWRYFFKTLCLLRFSERALSRSRRPPTHWLLKPRCSRCQDEQKTVSFRYGDREGYLGPQVVSRSAVSLRRCQSAWSNFSSRPPLKLIVGDFGSS